MKVLQSIISLVFLSCPITTLLVGADDDLGPPKNENAQVVATKPMGPEEKDGPDDLMASHTSRGGGLIHEIWRWPNATVNYYMDPRRFSEVNYLVIKRAMITLEYWTCIRFRQLSRSYIEKNSPDYVDITSIDGLGCVAWIGRKGGKQLFNLEYPRCLRTFGTILHELIHAIGVVDEHRRPDRDNYVTIYEQNIRKDKKEFFRKEDERFFGNFGVPYDYNSVLQYSEDSFSIGYGKKTMEPKVKGVKIGQTQGMTVRDAMTIMRMYNCSFKEFNVSNTDPSSKFLPTANEAGPPESLKGWLYDYFYRNNTWLNNQS